MITLSDGTATVELPDDLYWEDEHWSPVEQAMSRSLTGAAIIQVAAAQKGRPITLAPPSRWGSGGGWMKREHIPQIQAWADTPGQVLTLTLRGQAHSVVWRHQDAPAFEAENLWHSTDPQPDQWCMPTFRLMTVED